MSWGGAREGSGRREGVPNKATAELREYASQFTKEAVDGLLSVARDKEASHQARVAAWDKILDRAVGKAPQAHVDSDGNNLAIPSLVSFIIAQQKESDNRT